jgi:hypothetical protein
VAVVLEVAEGVVVHLLVAALALALWSSPLAASQNQ